MSIHFHFYFYRFSWSWITIIIFDYWTMLIIRVLREAIRLIIGVCSTLNLLDLMNYFVWKEEAFIS